MVKESFKKSSDESVEIVKENGEFHRGNKAREFGNRALNLALEVEGQDIEEDIEFAKSIKAENIRNYDMDRTDSNRRFLERYNVPSHIRRAYDTIVRSYPQLKNVALEQIQPVEGYPYLARNASFESVCDDPGDYKPKIVYNFENPDIYNVYGKNSRAT